MKNIIGQNCDFERNIGKHQPLLITSLYSCLLFLFGNNSYTLFHTNILFSWSLLCKSGDQRVNELLEGMAVGYAGGH